MGDPVVFGHVLYRVTGGTREYFRGGEWVADPKSAWRVDPAHALTLLGARTLLELVGRDDYDQLRTLLDRATCAQCGGNVDTCERKFECGFRLGPSGGLAYSRRLRERAERAEAALAGLLKVARNVAEWDGHLRKGVCDLPELHIDVTSVRKALASLGYVYDEGTYEWREAAKGGG